MMDQLLVSLVMYINPVALKVVRVSLLIQLCQWGCDVGVMWDEP